MLHKNICLSEKMNLISWFEQVLWIRILVNSDDYGLCFSASGTIDELCFPTKNVGMNNISRGVRHLVKVGLLESLTDKHGRVILRIAGFEKYQNLRNDYKKRTYFEDTGFDFCNETRTDGVTKPERNSPSEVEVEVKVEVEGEAERIGTPPVDNFKKEGLEPTKNSYLITLYKSQNRNLLTAYPNHLKKFVHALEVAVGDGWSRPEVEKRLYEIAGKDIPPWEIFKRKEGDINWNKLLSESN